MRNCIHCNTPFEPRNSRQTCCGRSCIQRANYVRYAAPREPRDCPTCEREFTPKRVDQFYCGSPCKRPKKPTLTPRQLKRCVCCDEAFIAVKPLVNYCSDECRRDLREHCRKVPCRGGCGRLRHKVDGQAPLCHHCRRETGAGRKQQVMVETNCAWCSASLMRSEDALAEYPRSFCDMTCRARFGNSVINPPRKDRASRRAADRIRCAKRRALKQAAIVEVVEPDVVFERDGWRCHICHRKVDKRLPGTHRMGPTLDHLIPLSEGGEHSYANTALAHKSCNSAKGRKGQAQLLLVG